MAAMTRQAEDKDKDNTKAGLKAWWSAFAKAATPGGKKERRVFGEPLRTSLKYASVAISMAGDDGRQYVWGYVPVIVAKVGLYLKENATEVEGVFRIAGSQKRMRELQETFDTPPKYGKNVDWSKYSVHDAASVLRRYLNQMPEPIVPLHLYSEFRNVMVKKPLDVDSAIKTYRLLITSSPPANQYLLLYVLDLLAVFARKSDVNLMTAGNLAVIFQPGIFSHPSHLTSADEHKLAVEVLEFLIEHQDYFVLGLSPPPPANIPPAELTAVSQPPPPREEAELMAPSDSDEDLGELEVHEGGGAALARSISATQTDSRPGHRRAALFGRQKRSASREAEDTAGRRSEREQIGGPANAPTALLRRNKTTPTRKANANGPGSAASTPTRSVGRRRQATPGGGGEADKGSPARLSQGEPRAETPTKSVALAKSKSEGGVAAKSTGPTSTPSKSSLSGVEQGRSSPAGSKKGKAKAAANHAEAPHAVAMAAAQGPPSEAQKAGSVDALEKPPNAAAPADAPAAKPGTAEASAATASTRPPSKHGAPLA